jgi:hypothetical protein
VTHDRIEELLRGDVPAEDPAARERARVRLRATIGFENVRPPARRSPRLAAFAAASVAAAVVLLLLQLLLPVGRVGPQLSAAAEIRQLGKLSSQQPSIELSESQYIYRREEEDGPERYGFVGEGIEYTLRIHAIVESWVSPNGSGRTRTIYQSVEFASLKDREAWQAAGSPQLPTTGEPPMDVVYPRGGLTFYAVDELPTEPAALEMALSKGDVIAEAPGDANHLSTIGTLLAQGDASSDLRQALFEVAAGIPGVVVDNEATDPVGRPAVSVSVTDPSGETRLYFDPIDASLLGTTRSHPATDEGPESTDWHVYSAWGVVSDVDERPSR